MESEDKEDSEVSIHWFRLGLRLHDNPALLESLRNCSDFYPVFILDESIAGIGTSAFPRMRFLFESLHILDLNLRSHGSRLYVVKGKPVKVFEQLFKEWGVTKLTFEQDPEPVYRSRDDAVKSLCDLHGVQWSEHQSRLLWDPARIIEENGGEPPLTYAMFCQVAEICGLPPRPVPDPDFSKVFLQSLDDDKYCLPDLSIMGVGSESASQQNPFGRYLGGENRALKLLAARLNKQHQAFLMGYCHPTQRNPDLTEMPLSLSPHIRFGTLSIRKFYWALRDLYSKIFPERSIPSSLASHLIWREYFFSMSFNNPNYGQMKDNQICLDINWCEDDEKYKKWEKGETGFPWIDACMRQLTQEGWIHHVCRTATACFLTRGDLWLNWEKGFKLYERYLIDADWSVCAGNWMWVSSSAFEKVLQCPACICPVRYGKRMDRNGEYVRRYVPEVRNLPLKYLFEPWKAPLDVQEDANCIVGKDYPAPMVDHLTASLECKAKMEAVKNVCKGQPHIGPANEDEVLTMTWTKDLKKELDECCSHNIDIITKNQPV